MNHCIYDVNDECTHDCEGCPSRFVRCSCCGCDSGEFFRLGDEILCLDCMIEENGEEYHADFAAEYEDEFRDFILKLHSKQRIAVLGEDCGESCL